MPKDWKMIDWKIIEEIDQKSHKDATTLLYMVSKHVNKLKGV